MTCSYLCCGCLATGGCGICVQRMAADEEETADGGDATEGGGQAEVPYGSGERSRRQTEG